MKLDVKAMALVLGLLWGGCLLVVGAAATVLGPTAGSYYGKEFLLMIASVYPGYAGTPGWGNALIGAGYGFIDGFVGGAILAWLYNKLARNA